MNPRGRYVLDSFAFLAYLEDEPGAATIRDLLEFGRKRHGSLHASVINIGEVAYITERERGLEAAHRTVALIAQLPITPADADLARTFAATHIKARHNLSYADAFAVGLACEMSATVVTGDPEFRQVEALTPVLWLPAR